MTKLTRDQMASRIGRAIPPGSFINLGIGMPTLVAGHVARDSGVMLHSENGIMGFGGPPPDGEEDWDLTDASKRPVTMLEGGSYFDSTLSFALMRGGHLDVAVLGGFEVSAAGDLANWWTGEPGSVQGVGGAMDLASGARAIWVMMEHVTRDGQAKLVERCRYPLTAPGVVTRVFTDLGVFAVTPTGFLVEEMVAGLDLADLQAVTDAKLRGEAIGVYTA